MSTPKIWRQDARWKRRISRAACTTCSRLTRALQAKFIVMRWNISVVSNELVIIHWILYLKNPSKRVKSIGSVWPKHKSKQKKSLSIISPCPCPWQLKLFQVIPWCHVYVDLYRLVPRCCGFKFLLHGLHLWRCSQWSPLLRRAFVSNRLSYHWTSAWRNTRWCGDFLPGALPNILLIWKNVKTDKPPSGFWSSWRKCMPKKLGNIFVRTLKIEIRKAASCWIWNSLKVFLNTCNSNKRTRNNLTSHRRILCKTVK